MGCLNNRMMLATEDAATYCAEGDWRRENWTPTGAAVCAAETSPLPVGSRAPLVLGFVLALAGAAALGLRRTAEA